MEVRASRRVWTETGWEIVHDTDRRPATSRQVALAEGSFLKEDFWENRILRAAFAEWPKGYPANRAERCLLPSVVRGVRGVRGVSFKSDLPSSRSGRVVWVEEPFRRRIRMGIDDRGDLAVK